MAEVKAKLNNLRISPRKTRLVVNLLRGKNINEALSQLEFMVKRSSDPIKKLISSAVANAENNFNMVKDNLFIKTFLVDEGAKLLRYRAKGFGKSEPIQKKTSLVTLVLGEKVPGLKGQKKRAGEAMDSKKDKDASVDPNSIKTRDPKNTKKPEIKKEVGEKSTTLGNLGKKIFNRKAI